VPELDLLYKALFIDADCDGLLVACAPILSLQKKIPDAEFACVSNALPKRQHEFTAGRILARVLAAELGIEYSSLIRKLDRNPAWPEPLCGCITHCDTYCAVAVGSKDIYPAIGLDVESIGRVDYDLWEAIYTSSEVKYLLALPAEQVPYAATAIFSAKESFYKFQYNYTQAWADFHDVEVTLVNEKYGYLTTLHKNLNHIPQTIVRVQSVDQNTLATLIYNKTS
jgi:4'-phosphopantetheinyl transferase EntD